MSIDGDAIRALAIDEGGENVETAESQAAEPVEPAADETTTDEPQEGETAPTDDETATEGEGEGDGGENGEAETFRQLMARRGHALEQYKSDDALADGISEFLHAYGRKNEDAVVGRKLKERLSDAGIESLLTGGKESITSPKELPDAPGTFEEYELLMDALRPDSGASEAAQQRALKAARAFSEQNFGVVTGEKARAEEMAALKKEVESLKTGISDTTETTKTEAWLAQHSKELFADKGGHTLVGKKVDELMRSDPDLQALAEARGKIPAWNIALKIAKNEQPQPRPTRKSSRQSQHQPSTSAAGDEMRNAPERVAKMMEEGVSDVDILKSLQVTE